MLQFFIDNVGNGIARTITFHIHIGGKDYAVKYDSNSIPDLINGFPSSKRIDINSMKKLIISIDNELIDFEETITQKKECVLIIRFTDYYENEYEQRYFICVKRIHNDDGKDIPKRGDSELMFGRYYDTLDIEINKTTYPKLININEDFNKLYQKR